MFGVVGNAQWDKYPLDLLGWLGTGLAEIQELKPSANWRLGSFAFLCLCGAHMLQAVALVERIDTVRCAGYSI